MHLEVRYVTFHCEILDFYLFPFEVVLSDIWFRVRFYKQQHWFDFTSALQCVLRSGSSGTPAADGEDRTGNFARSHFVVPLVLPSPRPELAVSDASPPSGLLFFFFFFRPILP